MIAVRLYVIYTMFPYKTAAAAGENTGKLCKTASDQGIHNDSVTGVAPLYSEYQSKRKHDKGNENEYADDTVHGACDAEEVHLLSVGNKAPYTTESV